MYTTVQKSKSCESPQNLANPQRKNSSLRRNVLAEVYGDLRLTSA